MSDHRSLARSEQWWHHKVPPIVAVAALSIGLAPGPATGRDLVDLVLLVVSVAGVAAFGHLLNDWTDIEADARGGKPNALAARSPARRAQLVVAALVAGLVPWIWLPHRPAAQAALAVEVLLLVAYSVPPVRLKGRGWLGAVSDAAYAYAVPFVMVALLLGPTGEGTRVPIALLGAWGLLVGLRGILWHQLDDVGADRAAGVETVASRVGPSATEALVSAVLLPLELALFVALLVVVPLWWLPVLLGVFVLYRTLEVVLLWLPPVDLRGLATRDGRVRIIGFEYVNAFLERWVALAALVALTADRAVWWLAVLVFPILFRTVLWTFLSFDIWVIPDAIERLVYSRGIRGDIKRVADRRTARVAAGPPPLDDPTRHRFVFVVCGPIEHLLTLRTAVHHLRAVTRVEIWVLTDSTRNEQVIDIVGVDRVVDVRTPAELDHHQASIWLKTSVHRHLPAGEWCYLDSDIIAAVPGVEGVFAERRGPVAFASDVTIRENSVDRFSPWAMTCECVGYGDQHSCTHLREQLAVRFGLEVPGDWLHWNGGVFAFGPDSAEFLDLWHERAVASFEWPEWKTRDQGALIATVWSLGLQDLHRISPEFNFIADLGNDDLCLDLEQGWAHHPAGPWYDAKLLHLYTSPLDDPSWDLGDDVEAVVLRRSRVRVHRYRRSELRLRARHLAKDTRYRARDISTDARAWTVDNVADVRWGIQSRLELFALRARRVPRRLTVARISRAVRARLGQDVSHLPIPGLREPEPQRSVDRHVP